MLITLLISLTFSQQDIKRVGVCGSSTYFLSEPIITIKALLASLQLTGNETVTLADDIKKYDTDKLIKFLRGEKELGLKPTHFDILREKEVSGRAFLDFTKQDFRDSGLRYGQLWLLQVSLRKEKKKLSFSSYKTQKDLKEVLAKHGIEDGRITDLPQFTPSKFIFAVG